MRVRSLVLALSLVAAGPPLRAQLPPALEPLRFLLGQWVALPGADTSGGAGMAAFSLILQDRVIVRRSYAAYPASGGRPASRHDDLMVIYAQGDSARADYYDNEGHVIRYAVRAAGEGEVVFLSDKAAREPRYRLTYTRTSDTTVSGRFDIAPPGARDAFRTYLAWVTRRVRSPGAP